MLHLYMQIECLHNTPFLFLGRRSPLVLQLLHPAHGLLQSGMQVTLETKIQTIICDCRVENNVIYIKKICTMLKCK